MNGGHLRTVLEAHGVEGLDVTADGDVVYVAHPEEGPPAIFVDGERITGGETAFRWPVWLDGRETVLARADGPENAFDLVEVDPATGGTETVATAGINLDPVQSPADPDEVAFLSTRDGGFGLYRADLDAGSVERVADTDRQVGGHDYAPDGCRIVFQDGTTEGSAIRIASLDGGPPRTLLDRPDSEETLGVGPRTFGSRFWGPRGVLVASNARGYADVGVVDVDGVAGDGPADATRDVEWVATDDRDAVAAGWAPGGERFAYLDLHPGETHLAVGHVGGEDDGVATRTVAGRGVNGPVGWSQAGDPVYVHRDYDTAGDVRVGGECHVVAGRVDVPLVEPRVVEYESGDGERIHGLLYDPAMAGGSDGTGGSGGGGGSEDVGGPSGAYGAGGQGGSGGPGGDTRTALVYAHGGWSGRNETTLAWKHQAMASRGHAVLAPDYRGSDGHGRAFGNANVGDVGGPERRDLVAAADHLRDRGYDPVGIYGLSVGGYLTLLSVATSDAFDAGVAISGFADPAAYVRRLEDLGVADTAVRMFGGRPDERPEFYAERSPAAHADDITAPLLLAYTGQDEGIPPESAAPIRESLADRGVENEFVVYEDENHTIEGTPNRIDLAERMGSFLDDHLPG